MAILGDTGAAAGDLDMYECPTFPCSMIFQVCRDRQGITDLVYSTVHV
jgi:hypothetical protein